MTQINNFKFNWPFFGNSHIIDFLQTSIANNNLSHFYIFTGARDLGKSTIANYFVQSLLCDNFVKETSELPCRKCSSCHQAQAGRHSDILQITKLADKKNISIEQVRPFIKMMNMGAFVGRYKVGIIKSADELSTKAANALLKTLEETKKDTIIILMVDFLENLPYTIISRAQVLKFLPAKTGDIHDYLITQHKAGRAEAKSISRFSLGRPALAVKFLSDINFLQKRKIIINLLLDIMASPLYKRFLLIDEIFKIADKNCNQCAYAQEILLLWQILTRDLMLKNINAADLVAADDILHKNKHFNIKINLCKLIDLNKHIEQGKRYLIANVQPRLVLENISFQS